MIRVPFAQVLALGAWLGAAAAGLGCARSESGADRQLAQLRDEIRRVQADHDRVDQRLAALELRTAEVASTAPDAAQGESASRLRVVRLTPDGTATEHKVAAETASSFAPSGTDDASPRPTIRVTGASRGGVSRGRAGRGQDAIEETLPDDPPPGMAQAPAKRSTIKASALDPEAKRAYEQALALVQRKQFEPALEAFAGFLVRYPDHPYADNAMYWRGEAYFAKGEYARAADEFEGTLTRFPAGNKVPDSLLKLGMCQQKLGMTAKARLTFERLAREQPDSEAARRIPREETP